MANITGFTLIFYSVIFCCEHSGHIVLMPIIYACVLIIQIFASFENDKKCHAVICRIVY